MCNTELRLGRAIGSASLDTWLTGSTRDSTCRSILPACTRLMAHSPLSHKCATCQTQRARNRLSAHMHHIGTIIDTRAGDRLSAVRHKATHAHKNGNMSFRMICLQHYLLCEVHVHVSYNMICLITFHSAHPTTVTGMLLISFHYPRPLRLRDLMKIPRNKSSPPDGTCATSKQALNTTHARSKCDNERCAMQ